MVDCFGHNKQLEIGFVVQVSSSNTWLRKARSFFHINARGYNIFLVTILMRLITLRKI
jgi:hypothetical protein